MTSTVGIVGYPLRHSVSPVFQQAAFDHLGIDARYLAWETLPNALAERMESLRGPGLLGANVTVPHKQAVAPFLDKVSQAAQDTGAVNTIVNQEGRLTGHNTDVTGFLKALQVDAGFQAQGKRGTGARRRWVGKGGCIRPAQRGGWTSDHRQQNCGGGRIGLSRLWALRGTQAPSF